MSKSKITELLMMEESSLTEKQKKSIGEAKIEILREAEERGYLNDTMFGC